MTRIASNHVRDALRRLVAISADLFVLGVPAGAARIYAALYAEVAEGRVRFCSFQSVRKTAALGALVCLRHLLLRFFEQFDTLPQRFNFLRHTHNLLPDGQLFQQLEQVS